MLFRSPCCITARVIDHDSDLVEPEGCLEDLQEGYGRNAVVLWDHEANKFPVGHSLEPGSGKLAVRVSSERIMADCYFKPTTQREADIEKAVMTKVVKMASIGFAPKRAERLRSDKAWEEAYEGPQKPGGGPGWHFISWSLLEWSWCAIGANPEALAAHLGNGKVKDADLRRSLEPYAAKVKAWANGIGPGKDRKSVV